MNAGKDDYGYREHRRNYLFAGVARSLPHVPAPDRFLVEGVVFWCLHSLRACRVRNRRAGNPAPVLPHRFRKVVTEEA